jgi:photosystem II stability/assembly factor-like uncharacterized protein
MPSVRALLSLLALLVLAGPARSAQGLDDAVLAPLAARSIGPAGMSGRVASVCASVEDPNLIYVGAATGGVWRSRDGGLSWTPVFDDQPAASIGAVQLFQPSPEVVWVGTGEGNPRNSTSVGKGIFRSLDGGATWQHLGLEETEKIHRIVLHPEDPDTAWVGALGPTWSDGKERGVYKTTDGGRTWRQVLFVDERTGCADLVADPRNPNKLFAAMWSHRREPWTFTSGGEGSGLFVSRDGGESWERLDGKGGFPAGPLGRMGIAIARSRPEVVYALVEAEGNSLVRSEDGGVTWRTMNDDDDVAQRPFYYADIRVDPKDPDRVYNLSSIVRVSNDGGRSFETFIPYSLIHPDHHALWIHPERPELLIDGNDGGVAISTDHGESWRFCRALPLAQFYHIAVDQDVPYHVYGGMQDNGSWRGPNDVWENGGIRNHHWQEVGFGDGFATVPLPQDSTKGYAMSQGGALLRWDVETGERRMIRPVGPKGVDLRFNWNAAIALDPFDPENAVYYGSQFLHRSPDQGASWQTLSPDLTTNNPDWQEQAESGGLTPDVTAAENFCSILTIAPSPLERGTIWVGTDDGRVQLTRDGGETWESLEENVLGVPRHTWVPHIEASKHDPATAYAVFDDHRRGDWTTHVYRTTDHGRSWVSIAAPNVDGYAHCIEEDPVDPDLLFLGTEFGLWVSTDAGRSWSKWTSGLPTVGVRALVVHPREHDLVVGTHGRAAYVIDDISPLRDLEAGARPEALHLFPLSPAQQHRTMQTGASRFPGTEEFRGETSDYGAAITFWYEPPSEEPAEQAPESDEDDEDDEDDPREPELVIEVHDAEGTLLRSLEPSPRRGLNRVHWNLRRDGFRRPGQRRRGGERPAGPEVPPGRYRVVLRAGEQRAEGELLVLADPRSPMAPEAYAARWSALRRLGELQERVADLVDAIDRIARDVDVILDRANEDHDPDAAHPHRELVDAGDALKEALEEARAGLVGERGGKGIRRGGDDVMSRVGTASWGLSSSWETPSPAHLRRLEDAEEALDGALPAVRRVLGEELAAFRAAVEEAGVRLLPLRGGLEDS